MREHERFVAFEIDVEFGGNGDRFGIFAVDADAPELAGVEVHDALAVGRDPHPRFRARRVRELRRRAVVVRRFVDGERVEILLARRVRVQNERLSVGRHGHASHVESGGQQRKPLLDPVEVDPHAAPVHAG